MKQKLCWNPSIMAVRKKVINRYYSIPAVKHGDGSIMPWGWGVGMCVCVGGVLLAGPGWLTDQGGINTGRKPDLILD